MKSIDFSDRESELFDLISSQSILKSDLSEKLEDYSQDSKFLDAVRRSIEKPALMSNRLFEIRASGLLGYSPMKCGGASLSGNVIGLEIAGAISKFGNFGDATLVASGHIANLYEAALSVAGIQPQTVSAESAVQRGLYEAALQIFLTHEEKRRQEA